MKKLKQIKCEKRSLQVGDIVISKDKSCMYVIIEINHTLLHNHKIYKVFYLNNGEIKEWMLEEMSEVKNILRLENKEVKGK